MGDPRIELQTLRTTALVATKSQLPSYARRAPFWPAWFIRRLGVDFREDTEAPQQERTVVGIAVHADALVPEILSEVKASIDQTIKGGCIVLYCCRFVLLSLYKYLHVSSPQTRCVSPPPP